jgi:uncharacterized membrane protein YdbT with pleckstrin-like domain
VGESDDGEHGMSEEAWSLRNGEVVVAEAAPYVRSRQRWYLYLVIPTFGVTALMFLVSWLYYRLVGFRWTLTNQRIVASGGWLSKGATSVLLEKIQEVNYGRTFWDRKLFSTGVLSVETAATQGTTVFRPLRHDDPFREAVEEAWRGPAGPGPGVAVIEPAA